MKTSFLFLLFFCLMTSYGHLYGQHWHALGEGLNGPVHVLKWYNGQIYAGGNFTDAGGDPDGDYLARWDGEAWHAVGAGLNGAVWSIAFADSTLYVGGAFINAGENDNADHIAYWENNTWNALQNGLDGPVYALLVSESQDKIYAGGNFTGGLSVCTLNTRSWHWVGSPLNDAVYSLLFGPTGNLIAGGAFYKAGGIPGADKLASFANGKWSAFGQGFDDGEFGWIFHSGVRDLLLDLDDPSDPLSTYRLYFLGDFNECPPPDFNPDPYLMTWNGNNYLAINPPECRMGSKLAKIGDDIFIAVIDLISNDAGIHHYDFNNKKWSYFSGSWVVDREEDIYGIALETDGNNLYVGHSFHSIGGLGQKPVEANNIAMFGDRTTATTQLSVSNNLSVYPNPVQHLVHFSLGDEVITSHNVILYDLQGKTMLNVTTADTDLDLASIPPGIYVLEVTSGAQCGVAKILKSE